MVIENRCSSTLLWIILEMNLCCKMLKFSKTEKNCDKNINIYVQLYSFCLFIAGVCFGIFFSLSGNLRNYIFVHTSCILRASFEKQAFDA